ncbi:hypothetical protein [Ramlibacter sp.]|uniref:hypothetical protein n=1 Tax=Ramlibacter sp. TaxID=1917967 RepID=UPI0026035ED4|nr:hypothetical protein [Ramlibacter sp.]MDB5955021.1 hypothetical protein [Ramlibacter sp.]
MDYRYTEDFARQMEAAEWRAHELREKALTSLWQAIAHGVANALRRVRHRLAGTRTPILPEA